MGDTDRSFVKHRVDDEGIAILTLNRPERMNAFNFKMRDEMINALRIFENDVQSKVLIITGEGKAFSTGQDLSEVPLSDKRVEVEVFARNALSQYHMIVRKLLGINKPIIAVINGVAAGAGLSIALACDYRFAAKVEGRVLVPAFSKMGLIADSGMTLTLPRAMRTGSVADSAIMCEGVMEIGLSVSWAQDFGIVESVFSEERILEEVKTSVCQWLLKLSPIAYAWSKRQRNRNLLKELNEEIFPWEIRAQADCLNSDYFKERARAFLEKGGR